MKLLFYIIFCSAVYSQTMDVTFRYIERPTDDFVRVFVPGTMPSGTSQDWGPNSNGVISANASSKMVYNSSTDSYEKTYSLDVGQEYLYKIHFHHNNSGTDYSWVSDPLNMNVSSDGYANSILNVTNPLFLQPARHLNSDGLVDGLSIGVSANGNIGPFTYSVGGDEPSSENYIFENSVFYVSLDPPRSLFESYDIDVSINGQWYQAYSQSALAVIEEPMPQGLQLGPNWMNGVMYVAIYAPHQPVMQLIVTDPGETGLVSDAMLMKKDTERDNTWWTEISMPNGTYDYEYLLLSGSRLPDPLSRMIVDGKTRIEIGPGGVSTVDDYNWQSDDYTRPSMDTLIIYELHIDDFAASGYAEGTFLDVVDKLDHLKELGINAIELMPITDVNWPHNWGYDPNHHLALKELYGTPGDLKYLVDQAHLRGIAVILDMVWNHVRSDGPLWKIQPDYALNPYIKVWTELNPNETQESWGAQDLDHFNAHTVDYVNQVNRILVDEYRIDGFRFDAARYIGWSTSQPELGLLGWTDALHDHDPTIIQTIEYLPIHNWLQQNLENTGMTSAWFDSFHDNIKNDIHGQLYSTTTMMKQIVELHEYNSTSTPYSDRNQAIKFMISHDEQSVIQEMVEFSNYSLLQARDRDKFYATILFTSLGVPMLLQGQEFGFKSGWLDDNGNGNWDEEKLDYRPLDWGLLNTNAGQDHLTHYKNLISLRKSNPAFSKGTFFDLWRYSNQRVIVYGYKDERQEGQDDQVVVIANFSSSDQTITNVPFLSAGQWYNALSPGDDLYTGDGNYGEYMIPAKSAVVYTNNEYQLNIDSNIDAVPEDFQILSAYPNPFNARVTININSSMDTDGNLDIFDISGRLIKSFNTITIINGNNKFEWDGLNNLGKKLPSGVYITSLKTELGILNRKIILVK